MSKTIVFGFDGTIVNSRDLVIELYNNLAERNGYKKIEKPEIKFLSGLSLRDRCKALNVPSYKIPLVALDIKKNYKSYLCSLKIQEGIHKVLHRLKENGIDLCIISSNNKDTIIEYFQKNNINIFTHIYTSKNLFGKHFTINRFVKKFNLDKKNILYIGGEVRDIISCKKAGVKIASVGWGYDSTELLASENPDFLINSPDEIIEIANKF